MGLVKISGYKCERCGYVWKAREEKIPIVCAKCKSPYWNIPRKNKMKKTGRKK